MSSLRQRLNSHVDQTKVAQLLPITQNTSELHSGHPSHQRAATGPQGSSNHSGLGAEKSHPSFGSSRSRSALVPRPSIGRRLFGSTARFFITALIGVGCTLAWQSHGEDAKRVVATWAPSLGWLLPVSIAKASTSAVASFTSPELGRQLGPMASNIALVLINLEQLAAKQEQITRDISALQAIEQNKQAAPPPSSQAIPAPTPEPATRSSAAPPRRVSAALPPTLPTARSGLQSLSLPLLLPHLLALPNWADSLARWLAISHGCCSTWNKSLPFRSR